MTAEKDAREHHLPGPGPDDDGGKVCQRDVDQRCVCGQDASGEAEDLEAFAKRVAAFPDGIGPEDREDAWYKGQPAHGGVLDAVSVPCTGIAGDMGVEGE